MTDVVVSDGSRAAMTLLVVVYQRVTMIIPLAVLVAMSSCRACAVALGVRATLNGKGVEKSASRLRLGSCIVGSAGLSLNGVGVGMFTVGFIIGVPVGTGDAVAGGAVGQSVLVAVGCPVAVAVVVGCGVVVG